MTRRQKTYIFDYLGSHCGMHYYLESFGELMQEIQDHDVEVLSNFVLPDRKRRFMPSMFSRGRICGAMILLFYSLKLFFKRILHPSARFIFLSYGNRYEEFFFPAVMVFGSHNVVDIHEAVAQKDAENPGSIRCFRCFYRHVARNVITHSARTEQYLDSFGYKGQRLFVPHFKYRLRKSYDPSNIGEEVRNAFDSGRTNVLFFGNITREKGADLMLEAYAGLEEAQRDRLNIVVAGKDKDGSVYSIDLSADRRVHIISRHINDDELVKLYSETDYVALPYRMTSQSGIMEMAFYFRKPVIATSVPYFKATLERFPSFGTLTGLTAEDFRGALRDLKHADPAAHFLDCEYEEYEMKAEMKAFTRAYELHILGRTPEQTEENDRMLLSRERLFALVRASLDGRIDRKELFEGMNDDDWNRVYRLSVAQGVLAVAYDGMHILDESLQPIIDLRVQWGYNVEHIEKINEKHIAAATKLCRLYSAASVRMMIMKGLTLASRYPVSLHRQCGDIDIYLMGDYEKGNELVKEKGVKITYDFFVHSEFRVLGINVENHKVFVNNTVNRTGRKVQEYLETKADGLRPHPLVEGAWLPSPEFETVFMARHATWHYPRECIRLRDLVDWTVMLRSSYMTMDRASVIEALRDTGLDRWASIATGICQTHLGLDPLFSFGERYRVLEKRVIDDIITYSNPFRHYHSGVFATFYRKLTSRRGRKWCYDLIVPDPYYGNILSSIRDYIKYPWKIFTAKV